MFGDKLIGRFLFCIIPSRSEKRLIQLPTSYFSEDYWESSDAEYLQSVHVDRQHYQYFSGWTRQPNSPCL